MKPSPSRQGGTVATPQDPLSLAIEAANRWKAASNDAFAEVLTELAKARSELAESERHRVGLFDEGAKLIAKHAVEMTKARSELAQVTRERDEAREALRDAREALSELRGCMEVEG